MSLTNNKHITIYRDTEFEAFYDVDLKSRRKIILAHVVVHSFPVLFAVLISLIYPVKEFAYLLIIFSLFLYAITIIETVSYLFPKSRKLYKKYFIWVFFPIGIILGSVGYFVGIELIDYTQEDDFDTHTSILQIIISFVGVFVLFVISQFGLSQILSASRSLYTKKAKVEADIQFATEIQERILQEVSINHNGSAAFACSYPANELGGDYFELAIHDDQLFASIGDISGHSFGAGLLMTMTKSALQTHLQYNRDPAEVMSSLNTMLNQQTDRSMYATMALLKLDPERKKTELCNAGHLPVIQVQHNDGELIYRHHKGIGLGITTSAEYSNLEFPVDEGDLLILYSDGLIETRDEKMQIRDVGFFKKIVKECVDNGTQSPEEFATTILARIKESDHSKEMEDDSSIIVIKV